MNMEKLSGFSDDSVHDYEIKNRQVARRAAADGMVLLKNDGILPLNKGEKLALYGSGAVMTIKGGTGSGDVNSRPVVSLWEGLKNAGVTIATDEWLTGYEKIYKKAREDWRDSIWAELDKMSEDNDDNGMHFFDAYCSIPFVIPSGERPEKEDADTAMYVISRNAGEGADRTLSKGDYFLTDNETNDIDVIADLYRKVIIVLNTGGIIDMSFACKYSNISAILYISQPGIEAGNAFADIVTGKVTPSAKLTDTWAIDYGDYPSSAGFSLNDGDVETEKYTEGIYVGYRYFDTFEKKARYSFGYGLSYTNFEIKTLGITHYDLGREDTHIGIKVSVTNTGRTYSGREVVQVYVSCPQDGMSKEFRRLVGFVKTGLLAPGGIEETEVMFPLTSLTSYDEKRPGWVIGKGLYEVFVGDSLETSVMRAVIEADSDIITEKTEHICALEDGMELDELSAPSDEVNKRREACFDGFEADKSISGNRVTIHDFDMKTKEVIYDGAYGNVSAETEELVNSLTEDELIKLAAGDISKGQGNLGNAGVRVPGSAAQTSNCAVEKEIGDMVLADGPAGLRLGRTYEVIDGNPVSAPIEKSMDDGFFYRGNDKAEKDTITRYQYCTAIPVGTLLAQTWDLDLVKECGRAIADELEIFGVTLWLAPGMNIHRNPLCGRNFEYYSEDPVISGMMAAAMTNGVQTLKGHGTTIKHFACNNQENNRMGTDSIVSERVLREIYLKGFEIAVETSQPLAIMTSYNKVNGIHAANNYDLCTRAARCEWGFKGLIMTDWTTTMNGPDCTASGCMRAGNDLVMPGCQGDLDNIRAELDSGKLDLKDLKRSVSRIASIVLGSTNR